MATTTHRTIGRTALAFIAFLALAPAPGADGAAAGTASPTPRIEAGADLRALLDARAPRETQLPTEAAPLPVGTTVSRCEQMIAPDGQPILVGPGCNGSPSPSPAPGSSVGATEDEAPAEGCPGAFFPAHEQFARETRFAFPIEEREHIHTEPFVFHMDHDPEGQGDGLWNEAVCEPYETGRLCYDGHQGTDFALVGSFGKMGDEIHVVAAADGYVMHVQDGHPDRCSIDTRAMLCDSVPVCGLAGCIWVPYGCEPNPRFGEVVCPDGEDPGRYDDLGDVTNLVEICHADGTVSRYLHLMKDSTEHLEIGQRVDCGERIGILGSSGRSSAPHLHFDVYMWTPEYAEDWNKVTWIDPYTHDPAESLWTEQYSGWLGGLPGPECQ